VCEKGAKSCRPLQLCWHRPLSRLDLPEPDATAFRLPACANKSLFPAMTNDNNDTEQPGKVKIFLREWGSYAALLSNVVGPTLVWFGLRLDKGLLKWLLYGGLLLPVLGFVWLRHEYRSAKLRIEEDGEVQRPEWLWTLLTGGITHKSQVLSGQASVMVLVPPGMHSVAARLDEIYNHTKPHEVDDSTGEDRKVDSHAGEVHEVENPAGSHQLQFHYITQRSNGTIGEDEGTSSIKEATIRPLKKLAEELAGCAGIIFLDDSLWHERYPKTMEIVRQWVAKTSVRPIMAIRVDGGTLNYSWSPFKDVAGEDRGLHPRLLAQAINRGTQWWRQATTNRWLLLRLAPLTFALFLGCVVISYLYWYRDRTLERLTTMDQQERLKAAQAMGSFRSTPATNTSAGFNELLKANADEMRTIIERGSGVTAESHVVVMMFSVSRQGSLLRVEEIAASRNKPKIGPFTFDPSSPETKGIVTCAVAKRAFVLWTGENNTPPKTTGIRAWDLQGRQVGTYRPDNRLEFGNNEWCSHEPKPASFDDQRNQMLCVPVGVADNSGEVVGAICVSSVGRNFLGENWVRYLVTRFGTSLSFRLWDTKDQ